MFLGPDGRVLLVLLHFGGMSTNKQMMMVQLRELVLTEGLSRQGRERSQEIDDTIPAV